MSDNSLIQSPPGLNNASAVLGDLLHWAEQCFENAGLYFGHGTDNAWDEAVMLVLHGMQLPLDSSPEVLSLTVAPEQLQTIRQLVERRVNERLPAAYLTHEAWFAGLPFYVDERVLVPRSPLAELIERSFSPWLLSPPKRILDLCTGSGCIGIACAARFPDAEVVLSDISSDALAVANRNINTYDLDSRVKPIESDLFSSLSGQKFDLIISNPPYVDAADLAGMPAEYQHEPEIGLGSGDDGLDFTRRLLEQAADYLTEDGVLITEVGNSWEALDDAYPLLPFTWLEFERGGHGVFMLFRRDLVQFNGY